MTNDKVSTKTQIIIVIVAFSTKKNPDSETTHEYEGNVTV